VAAEGVGSRAMEGAMARRRGSTAVIRRGTLVVVAVLGLVAVASASRPAPVSRSTGRSAMPQPAADAAGNEVVVWSYDDGVHPTRIVGRALGEPIFTLSRPNAAASSPELAVNGTGHGVAAWR